MTPAPDATVTVAIVAGCASLGTLVLSKWFDANASQRREATEERRLADRVALDAQHEAEREAKHDLEMCQIVCERLRDERAVLLSDRAWLRALLAANGIAVPHAPEP